ncbi:MAG TPA: HEAT repeat domain-containing protein, partial [bacterium]|nr:HEAT repeat domain-containing protein [bacterium]HEX68343.1 HEAT repeat domain-containing protein [bacterium]
MKKKFLIAILSFFLSFYSYSSEKEEIKTLASQGAIKQSLLRYRAYCSKTGAHDPALLRTIFLSFLNYPGSKPGYAIRKSAMGILLKEVLQGKLKKEECISLFKERLSSSDLGVKMTAVEGLILLGYENKELIPVLKEALYKGDVVLSLDAALCLANLKIPETFSLLEEAFHSSNPFVAIAAVKGIKKYGGKRAEKILLE